MEEFRFYSTNKNIHNIFMHQIPKKSVLWIHTNISDRLVCHTCYLDFFKRVVPANLRATHFVDKKLNNNHSIYAWRNYSLSENVILSVIMTDILTIFIYVNISVMWFWQTCSLTVCHHQLTNISQCCNVNIEMPLAWPTLYNWSKLPTFFIQNISFYPTNKLDSETSIFHFYV